jgi:hypothetical protein
LGGPAVFYRDPLFQKTFLHLKQSDPAFNIKQNKIKYIYRKYNKKAIWHERSRDVAQFKTSSDLKNQLVHSRSFKYNISNEVVAECHFYGSPLKDIYKRIKKK